MRESTTWAGSPIVRWIPRWPAPSAIRTADRHLWAESFERSSKRRARAPGRAGLGHRAGDTRPAHRAEESRLASARAVNPDGYDAYLKGRYFFGRPCDENLQEAIA